MLSSQGSPVKDLSVLARKRDSVKCQCILPGLAVLHSPDEGGVVRALDSWPGLGLFTPCCSSALNCMVEYMALDIARMCAVSFFIGIVTCLNASRNQDGVQVQSTSFKTHNKKNKQN